MRGNLMEVILIAEEMGRAVQVSVDSGAKYWEVG
jgi:hypothetical protein